MPRRTEPLTTFPRRMRMAMAASNMTSADLMRRTTLGAGQISDYLNGHNEPKIGNLRVICEATGVSADFLLGLTDEMWRKKPRGAKGAKWE